jgi:sucrose-6-phosphate hydrolase SacC (GH32 family)
MAPTLASHRHRHDTPAGPGAAMPFVAADGERFYLSWTEPTDEEGPAGGHARVRMASIDTGGEWSAPVTLATSDRFFVNWADFPSVASAGTDASPHTGCSGAARGPTTTTSW